MTTTAVHIRIEETLKSDATETLAAMGLSLSDAVRAFLVRVVADQRIPFELRVPNAETVAALLETEEMIDSGEGRFKTAAELLASLLK